MSSGNEDESGLKTISKKFKTLTSEPEQFLISQPSKCDDILDLLQQIYHLAIESDPESSKSSDVLQNLVTEQMDEEQVWQQLEIRNDVVLPKLLKQTAKFLAIREEKLEIRLKEDEDEAETGEEEQNGTADDEEDYVSENELEDDSNEEDYMDRENEKKMPTKKKIRTSIVDDKFFKLGEMEEFLQAEDEKDMRKRDGKLLEGDDDDEIDYFAEDLGEGGNDDGDESENEEGDYNIKYSDFFDNEENSDKSNKNKKPKGKDHFAAYEDDNDDDDDDDDNGGTDAGEGEDSSGNEEKKEKENKKNKKNPFQEAKSIEPASDSDSDSAFDSGTEKKAENFDDDEIAKSTFELRQDRLAQRMREYEEIVLGEKPWQLKGEIQGTSRPQNSLLEEILEFDSSVRPPPIITEETTKCLEDIIKQRIKDQAWDDPERKVRPVQTAQEYRKELILNQEKSKESLAQIYEKDYQREMDKLKPNERSDADDAPEVEKPEHQEIRQMMQTLFVKLDALSNFHFTPKPVAPEPKIITNTPAIEMEEVAPVAVSDANLLAPQEVYRGLRHELIGKSERNRTDKKRERRKKKSKQRAIHKILEEKDARLQKLGIPLSKKEDSAKILKTLTKQRNVDKVKIGSDQKALKSSKAFFSKLQDSKTAGATTKAAKRKPDEKAALSAKKFKL